MNSTDCIVESTFLAVKIITSNTFLQVISPNNRLFCQFHFVSKRNNFENITFVTMIFSIEAITALAFLVIIPIAISFWSKSSLFRSIRGRHVVITGGSTGIGLWMAIQCVKLGAHVTIISRNVTKLESAIKLIKLFRMNDKQSIEFRSIDLSKSYEAVEKLFGALEEQVAPIYWLINCAGGEMHGRHIDMFQENANDLINSKYFAVYYPIRYVIAKMNVMGEGKITITGSQAKELLMELYGHKIFGCRECKLSSHGLPEIMNMKGLNKNISITLALTDKSGKDTQIFLNISMIF